jgi:putative oxidoreductase
MHASIAERIAYGTPLDPVTEDTRVHNVPRSTMALVGRLLIATLFIVAGIPKFTEPGAAVAYMSSQGIPNPDVLVYVAGAAEILGGLALAFGFLTRLAAVGLVIYLVPVTLYFHHFWNLEGMEAKTQLVNFTKNLALMGGLLMVAALGPARYSIDAAVRRPLDP